MASGLDVWKLDMAKSVKRAGHYKPKEGYLYTAMGNIYCSRRGSTRNPWWERLSLVSILDVYDEAGRPHDKVKWLGSLNGTNRTGEENIKGKCVDE